MELAGGVMRGNQPAGSRNWLLPAAAAEDQKYLAVGDAEHGEMIVGLEHVQAEAVAIEADGRTQIVRVQAGFHDAVDFRRAHFVSPVQTKTELSSLARRLVCGNLADGRGLARAFRH